MKNFNLSDGHSPTAPSRFFMVLLLTGGFCLFHCDSGKTGFTLGDGRQTLYPGATALEVEQQGPTGWERNSGTAEPGLLAQLLETGESVIFVTPREDTPPKDIPELWYQVRKKVGDIRMALPPGIVGPFSMTSSAIPTASSMHFLARLSYAELKQAVDSTRQQLLRVKDVEKVDLIGVQDEKIYVEFSDKKLAELGLDASTIAEPCRRRTA